jgi:hypothetical protein
VAREGGNDEHNQCAHPATRCSPNLL